MSNIFRSSEIYKHIKRNVYDSEKIVPVRGVYVAGVYTPVFCNDHGITIVQLTSTPARVDEFGTKETDYDKDSCNVIGMDFNTDNPLDITYYTRKQSEDDSTDANICDISFDVTNPLGITYYTRIQQPYNDGCNINQLSMSDNPIIIIGNPILKNDGIDAGVHITNIICNEATITNRNMEAIENE